MFNILGVIFTSHFKKTVQFNMFEKLFEGTNEAIKRRKFI